MKLLHVLVSIAALFEVSAGYKQYCGTMLVKVVEHVCPIGINDAPSKRSFSLVSELDVMDIYNKTDDNIGDETTSFLNKLLGQEFTNTYTTVRRHRGLLGIYNECCVKGCIINELASYCHNPGTTRTRTCGDMLVGALNTICTSGFNKLPTKRSVQNQIYISDVYNDTEPYHKDSSRLLLEDVLTDVNNNALVMIKRHRLLLGIHDECCVKGCNFSELVSYCY